MKNILVPSDFSNNAYNALFYATCLLKNHDCTFYILNVFSEQTPLQSHSPVPGKNRNLLVQLEEEAVEGLNKVYHRINLDNQNPRHRVKKLLEKGSLSEMIVKTVAQLDIDLVVMGNTGETAAKNVFLGSSVTHTISVLKTCPLLAVPKEIECEIPFEIAFATDYKRGYDAKSLEPLLFMAKTCKATVRIIHINEEGHLSHAQKSNLSTLKRYLGDIRHTVHWMPDFASKSKVIKTFLDELGIGMLVMINYQHGFVDSLLREPVIKRVSFTIDIPFLILPYHS